MKISKFELNNIDMELKIKDFIKDLQNYDPEMPLNFGGLDFYRLKDRGGFVHVEFGQTVYKDEDGKVIVENHIIKE